ncbi:MAG: phosphoribosylglycinamide formyltransferase, partial [Clostridiales bacterium]|nr:phosphoribosylglycinamide formyltransferase [Clostridiales bacterium]
MLSEKVRIAVLCSGGGTNFQAIINAQDAGMIPHGDVRLVITDHAEAYVLKRAERAGIKTAIVDRKEVPDRAEREQRILEILKMNAIEFIVFAGFMTILSENFVRAYPGRIINVHPALIPSFCGEGYYGLHVHEAVLARGV